MCASEKADGKVHSYKEVLKLVMQLMIEDIWSNFDNYQCQKRVIEQGRTKLYQVQSVRQNVQAEDKNTEVKAASGKKVSRNCPQ